jgi:Skp family chaperone for outer membrane proteins
MDQPPPVQGRNTPLTLFLEHPAMKPLPLFRHVTPILLAVLALSCSGPARTEPLPPKLAVIDHDRLLLESQSGKTLIAPLDALMKQKKAEAQALEEELRKIRASAMEQTATTSEQQRASLQRRFNDKMQDMRRFEAEANNELDRVRADAFGKFKRLSSPVIQAVGKEQGYTMIFRLQDAGLVYLDPSADITDLVIQRLNAQSAVAK